ncbi:MAG: hypothetical protein RSH78_05100, partial [Bacilli bacterium]
GHEPCERNKNCCDEGKREFHSKSQNFVLTNFYNNDLTRLIWCFVSSMIIQIILFYTIFITCKRKKIKEEKNI